MKLLLTRHRKAATRETLLISAFQKDQTRTLEVSVSEAAIESFAVLSGDNAPIHMDAAFARKFGFSGRVVHGAYLMALVSRFVGLELPGPRAVLERMDFAFRNPCYAPANLKIIGKVTQVSEAVSSIILQIEVRNANAHDLLLASGKSWHRILEE